MRRSFYWLAVIVGIAAIALGSFSYLQTTYAAYRENRERFSVPAALAGPGGAAPVSLAPEATGGPPDVSALLDGPGDDGAPAEPAPLPLSAPAPPQYSPPTWIVIPAIGVDAPVVPVGITPDGKMGAADWAAGHYSFSAYAGQPGNSVISAHVDTKGSIFRRLHELEQGDEVGLFAGEREFVYEVDSKRIVEPTDSSVLADTPGPVLTLITCYPYGVDSHRLVVAARLAS